MAAPIVLMLDGDIGFMFALSQELTARGISAYPARTLREARSMLQRFRHAPDVLVIDCTVLGACSFAEGMAEQRQSLGILGIVCAGHQCEECAKLLAKTLHRPDDTSPKRIPYCADVIQQVLRRGLGHDGHVNATWELLIPLTFTCLIVYDPEPTGRGTSVRNSSRIPSNTFGSSLPFTVLIPIL